MFYCLYSAQLIDCQRLSTSPYTCVYKTANHSHARMPCPPGSPLMGLASQLLLSETATNQMLNLTTAISLTCIYAFIKQLPDDNFWSNPTLEKAELFLKVFNQLSTQSQECLINILRTRKNCLWRYLQKHNLLQSPDSPYVCNEIGKSCAQIDSHFKRISRFIGEATFEYGRDFTKFLHALFS